MKTRHGAGFQPFAYVCDQFLGCAFGALKTLVLNRDFSAEGAIHISLGRSPRIGHVT